MLSQKPEVRSLVPIVRDALVAGHTQEPAQETSRSAKGAVEFAPSPEFVLSRLLPKYVEFTIFSAILETDAAFFAAQLVAMNNATENAGKLIDELTIQMNNARQAAITKELLEIVGGAEALVKG
jgi:F-type H+-transporting ATPase subunit gamma